MSKSIAQIYTTYPPSSVLIYNGTTVAHYLLGGTGIILGYGSWTGYLVGIAYIVLAFFEMYVHMPMKVCPNCLYSKLDNSRCVAGLNILSRKISQPGDIKNFGNRARGMICPNNLYIASLVFPISVMIPALIINFSWLVLAILLVVIGLLVFRFFVIFPKIACLHCRAKLICPQAKQIFKGLNTTQ